MDNEQIMVLILIGIPLFVAFLVIKDIRSYLRSRNKMDKLNEKMNNLQHPISRKELGQTGKPKL